MPVTNLEDEEDYRAWLVGIDNDLTTDMGHDHQSLRLPSKLLVGETVKIFKVYFFASQRAL